MRESTLYIVEFKGEDRHFTLTLRFLIRPIDIRVQTINPEAREEIEAEYDIHREANEILVKRFGAEKGSLGFELPEFNNDGTPHIQHITNEYRTFTYDSVFRFVSFKMRTSSGQLFRLELPLLEGRKGEHSVIFSWDYTKGGALSLDGVLITTKDFLVVTEDKNKTKQPIKSEKPKPTFPLPLFSEKEKREVLILLNLIIKRQEMALKSSDEKTKSAISIAFTRIDLQSIKEKFGWDFVALTGLHLEKGETNELTRNRLKILKKIVKDLEAG